MKIQWTARKLVALAVVAGAVTWWLSPFRAEPVTPVTTNQSGVVR